MDIKELKIQAPKGYEIDNENSTFECIKFKPIKRNITYEDICNTLFTRTQMGFYITTDGGIRTNVLSSVAIEKNNASNKEQLEKLLAANQLLNIATYYNSRVKEPDGLYTIGYNTTTHMYEVISSPFEINFGLLAYFNRKEDTQSVIDNPNFQEILYAVYRR